MKKLLAAVFILLPVFSFATAMDKLFDKNGMLRFDMTAKEITELEATARAEFDSAVAKITAIPAKDRTVQNTLEAFETAFTNYWYVPKSLALQAYFADNQSVRDAASALESKGSQAKAAITARKDIYKALKELEAKNPALTKQQRRLFDFWLSRFKRAGAELQGADAEEFARLTNRKMELITQFNTNLMNDKQTLALVKEQLKGMSSLYINRLDKTPEGKYIVTMKYPDYNPFMAGAQDENARKALQIKFANRGGYENVQLLEEVLQIRSATARMLGYKDHPQFVLEDRMAKDEKTLRAFLSNIEKTIKPYAVKDKKTYLDFGNIITGKKDKEMTLWNLPYYQSGYMKVAHSLDQEAMKEYFQTDYIIKGMFEIFGELFGVTYEKINLPKWHKDVQTYVMKDKETGKVISHFYFDLYPRPGKYTHAAAWTFIDGYMKADGKYQTPFALICGNFNPPGGGAPSILTHREVETLFHEFGHVMQMSLTSPLYASLGGDNLSWDYIEAHSQLLENWTSQKEVLKKITRHYKTGQAMPEDMMDALIAARTVGATLPMLRQNMMGQLDLEYHKSNKPVDTQKVYEKMSKSIYTIPLTEGSHPQGSFSHIMSLTDPYDVGYYVYAWSLVIADDLFSKFEEEGIMNKELGMKLRKYIYEPGMSEDPNEMVEKFLGRPYNSNAFFKSLGVETKK